MKAVIFLALSLAALASATFPTYVIPSGYNPKISEKINIDDGKMRYGLPALPSERGCWYLRFKVKAKNTVQIRFSTEDGDCENYYDVFIGMDNNRLTCVQRSTGKWLLDIKTPYILTGEWQYFYISQSYGHWSIGYQSNNEEIASFYDDDVYPVKYIGISSIEWSHWSIYHPGFGHNIVKTDIHALGEYKFIFPEIPYKKFRMLFAVKAGGHVSLVFSPSNGYGPNIYEIMFGVEGNTFSCLRRKEGEKPVLDVVSLDIMDKGGYRYFWVTYDGEGHIQAGLYGDSTPILDYQDDNPLTVRYWGVTSIGCESWWKFYTLCPDPQYVCQDEQFHLRCAYGLVDVTYALYGRENRYYCPNAHAKSVDCGDPEAALAKIREHCRGQQECVVDASNDFFGNPCSGTSKYLRIEYTCCVCN